MGKNKRTEMKPTADENSAEPAGDEEPTLTYEEKVELAQPIAHPMAPRKLAKKLFKVAKKAKDNKKAVVGLKSLRKHITKGGKGLIVLAGDTDPVDVISHFPLLCEEHGLPYVWVPSKKDLGNAIRGKGSVAVCIQSDEAYEEAYEETYEKVKSMPHPV